MAASRVEQDDIFIRIGRRLIRCHDLERKVWTAGCVVLDVPGCEEELIDPLPGDGIGSGGHSDGLASDQVGGVCAHDRKPTHPFRRRDSKTKVEYLESSIFDGLETRLREASDIMPEKKKPSVNIRI